MIFRLDVTPLHVANPVVPPYPYAASLIARPMVILPNGCAREEPVTICKQAASKEPVHRKVARIMPPGTVTDEALREECRDNLVVDSQIAGESFGVAAPDITRCGFSILTESKEQRNTTVRALCININPEPKALVTENNVSPACFWPEARNVHIS